MQVPATIRILQPTAKAHMELTLDIFLMEVFLHFIKLFSLFYLFNVLF